jgi:hypothetical protein
VEGKNAQEFFSKAEFTLVRTMSAIAQRETQKYLVNGQQKFSLVSQRIPQPSLASPVGSQNRIRGAEHIMQREFVNRFAQRVLSK